MADQAPAQELPAGAGAGALPVQSEPTASPVEPSAPVIPQVVEDSIPASGAIPVGPVDILPPQPQDEPMAVGLPGPTEPPQITLVPEYSAEEHAAFEAWLRETYMTSDRPRLLSDDEYQRVWDYQWGCQERRYQVGQHESEQPGNASWRQKVRKQRYCAQLVQTPLPGGGVGERRQLVKAQSELGQIQDWAMYPMSEIGGQVFCMHVQAGNHKGVKSTFKMLKAARVVCPETVVEAFVRHCPFCHERQQQVVSNRLPSETGARGRGAGGGGGQTEQLPRAGTKRSAAGSPRQAANPPSSSSGGPFPGGLHDPALLTAGGVAGGGGSYEEHVIAAITQQQQQQQHAGMIHPDAGMMQGVVMGHHGGLVQGVAHPAGAMAPSHSHPQQQQQHHSVEQQQQHQAVEALALPLQQQHQQPPATQLPSSEPYVRVLLQVVHPHPQQQHGMQLPPVPMLAVMPAQGMQQLEQQQQLAPAPTLAAAPAQDLQQQQQLEQHMHAQQQHMHAQQQLEQHMHAQQQQQQQPLEQQLEQQPPIQL